MTSEVDRALKANDLLTPHILVISLEYRTTGGPAGGGGVHVTMTKAEFTADCYNMDHKERGYAIIFNNRQFDASTGMGERTGTDVDAENLYLVLTEMGFNTVIKKDFTTHEMESFLVKCDYLSKNCSFFCFFTGIDLDL